MAVSFKVALQKSGLKPFKYRWVLIAACATFAWLSLRNTPETTHAPEATASPGRTATSGANVGRPQDSAAGTNLIGNGGAGAAPGTNSSGARSLSSAS